MQPIFLHFAGVDLREAQFTEEGNLVQSQGSAWPRTQFAVTPSVTPLGKPLLQLLRLHS